MLAQKAAAATAIASAIRPVVRRDALAVSISPPFVVAVVSVRPLERGSLRPG
jgi:hypothetical protein